MLSNKLAVPFVLGAIIGLYQIWEGQTSYIPFLAVCSVISAVIYTMSPQIDWWWAERNPPDLSPKLVEMFERFSPFYQKLDADGKKKFEKRVLLFMMGTDWTPQGWDDVPKDMEAILAAYAVQLTFHKERFLFDKFEKIIISPAAFPTPLYPPFHHSELYEPDGCMLFSGHSLMTSFLKPAEFYQIGLHEYGLAFKLSFPDYNWPTFEEADWSRFAEISGFSKQKTELATGMPIKDLLPVALHHYIVFPEKFRSNMPEAAAAFDVIFSGKEETTAENA